MYADITIMIKYLRKYSQLNKFIILDLDAHQGNGHERDFIGYSNVYIIDFFNPYIYPGDFTARSAIKDEVRITIQDDDHSYV